MGLAFAGLALVIIVFVASFLRVHRLVENLPGECLFQKCGSDLRFANAATISDGGDSEFNLDDSLAYHPCRQYTRTQMGASVEGPGTERLIRWG